MFKNLDMINILINENLALSDLYCLLNNYTDFSKIDAETQKIRDKYLEAKAVLQGTMSEEQRKLFNIISDISSEEESLHARQCFILGYKTATRLLLEGIK